MLRELARRDTVGGYDVPGNLLALVGLTGLVVGLSDAGLDGWTAPMVIVGLVAAVIMLPAFVWVEARSAAPMLDLSLFRIRVHCTAAAAAFPGMLLSAAGLAGMTTLEVNSPFWQSAFWLSVVGIGSGIFNSPNTSAMMSAAPPWRRGIASGTGTMLQNTGAVISIALMLLIVLPAGRGGLGPSGRHVAETDSEPSPQPA